MGVVNIDVKNEQQSKGNSQKMTEAQCKNLGVDAAKQAISDAIIKDVTAAINKEIDGLTENVDTNKFSDRDDYRDIPFVTIDGDDARDFDDAVFCEKRDDCWKLIVAIADVSYYVKQQSALNKEAYLRGTSVYFPNRVIPMLPEIL